MHNLTEFHCYFNFILSPKVDYSKDFWVFDDWFSEGIDEHLSKINLF